jgi:hypothetical protein
MHAAYRSLLRRLVGEPLVHFVVLGALLFLWSAWPGSGTSTNRVVITAGVVDHLAASFVGAWQRAPDDIELKGLIDDHIKGEIAAREAMAMGLDRDDIVIQRRLRQKLEFLLVDDAAPPTDAELQDWLKRHPERFRVEPQVSFRQVPVSSDRHRTSAAAVAAKLLARLRAAGPEARIEEMGDVSMLPAEVAMEPSADVARTFGQDFADKLTKLTPHEWMGPIESSFGLHIVLVRESTQGAAAELATVRPLVEREVQAERRRAQLQALYERLLSKYAVSVEMPDSPAAGTDARSAP